jgi:hypothetical protein
VKVEAAAERLKEANHFLEANLKAYEFAFVRLKKRVANVIYAINHFASQTVTLSQLLLSSDFISSSLLVW